MARHLPQENVDSTLSLLEYHWYSFARSTEVLPPEAIRRLLSRLEKLAPVVKEGSFRFQPAARVFLLTAVDAGDDDVTLSTRWRAAVNGLKVLHSQYAWGSKQKREKLTNLARSPWLLAATQASVASGVPVPDEMLATLVLDGTEVSCDALIPHLERGASDAAELERLTRLERFADPKGGAWPLIELVRARVAKSKSSSPFIALARQLGFPPAQRLRVQLEVQGTPRGARGKSATARIAFDSKREADFHAWVRVGEGWSGCAGPHAPRDDLHLGKPELGSLPQWFAAAAQKLRVTWNFRGAETAYLKGPRLVALLEWLSGP